MKGIRERDNVTIAVYHTCISVAICPYFNANRWSSLSWEVNKLVSNWNRRITGNKIKMKRTLFVTNLFYFYVQTVSQPCLKAQEHERLHTIKYTVFVLQQSIKVLF